MRPSKLEGIALSLTLLAPLAGCDGDAGESSNPRDVSVRFAAKVGAADFACTSTFDGLGTAATTLAPADMRFYVHDVELVDAGGTAWPVTLRPDGLWQTESLALLDFEDKTGTCVNGTAPTNEVITGTWDPGAEDVTIAGLRFKLGVPFELNHGDAATAASPLNLSGLFWSWQGGYKFMRLDMEVVGAAEPLSVHVHLGSTGCTLSAATQAVSSCSAPNRPQVELAGFDPATGTVVFDYAALVAGVDLGRDPYPNPGVGDGGPGCQSSKDDPECGAIFANLGLDLETGRPAGAQTVFRAE